MSDKTAIEWTDATWNPTTGCTKVSEGCRHCYAERFTDRFRGVEGHYYSNGFDVMVRPEKLDMPLRWNRPRKIFVNSTSDLFHDGIPDEYIDQVFAIILACAVYEKGHTFQLLTKRPKRMLDYFSGRTPIELVKAWVKAGTEVVGMAGGTFLPTFSEAVEWCTGYDWQDHCRDAKGDYKPYEYLDNVWPLPNLWLGVSVENQQAANERIPLLLQTPATTRFLSCEPLLGPVDLMRVELGIKKTRGYGERRILWDALQGWEFQFSKERTSNIPLASIANDHPRISWVIAGGESGPKARPMHPTWVRSLRDQCVDADVPFFFKQWGEFASATPQNCERPIRFVELDGTDSTEWTMDRHSLSTAMMARVGKRAAGRILDGRTWDEFPAATTKECATTP